MESKKKKKYKKIKNNHQAAHRYREQSADCWERRGAVGGWGKWLKEVKRYKLPVIK